MESELHSHIERFLRSIEALNWSPRTIVAYRTDLRGFADFLPESTRVADVDVTAVRAWMASLHGRGLVHKSIRRHVFAVRALFRMLRREGLISVNPAALVFTPKPAVTLPAVPGEVELGRFLDLVSGSGSPPRDIAVLELLYGTGIRVAEIVALNIGDVDREEQWLRIRGKGKKERLVPYTGKAAKALETYLESRPGAGHADVLFMHGPRGPRGQAGPRFTERGLNGLVRRYATIYAGDPSFHPHTFRHAFATHLMNSGAGLREIQLLMGHSSVAITARYVHLSMKKIGEVYEAAHPKA
jgi:integrase/recombinase XerC